MPREVTTFDEVVEALGGVSKTARISGVRPPAVCQWRSRFGAFPADYFLVISQALAARGYVAPDSVFRFARPGRVNTTKR